MKIRRIVTGERNGRSKLISDSDSPNTYNYEHIPGFSTSLIWSTGEADKTNTSNEEPAKPGVSLLPATGETKFMIVSFPPDSIFESSDFDLNAAIEEQQTNLIGLFDKFEVDSPGMHKTQTIDYGIVLSGKICLELDEEMISDLEPGSVIVQQATRHAWRNPTNDVAIVAFAMLGV